MEKFGPFAPVVLLVLALVATFSLLIVKSIGKLNKWTWLTDDSPSFLVRAGPQAIGISMMAIIVMLLNQNNKPIFMVLAVVFGLISFGLIARFDFLRKIHIIDIPVVGKNGAQIDSKKVVIGVENDMIPSAKEALEKARKKHGGVSLSAFLSGFGATKLYSPESAWDKSILAKNSNQLTLHLMGIVLFPVLSLFTAASLLAVQL